MLIGSVSMNNVAAQPHGSPRLPFSSAAAVAGDATARFDTLVYNFGTIARKSIAAHGFCYVNTGGKPLLIDNVRMLCSCTVADWSEEPLLPAARRCFNVEYNTLHRGRFEKTIKVYWHGFTRPTVLKVRGEVR